MSLSAEPVLTAPPQTPVAASILAAPATVYPLRFPDGKFSEKTEISVTQIDPNLPRTAVFQAPATAQTHDARHLVAQVVAQIVKGATGAVDIRLDPPELGRVSLTLSLGDDAVTAVIAADRADTQDLLRRHADMLQRALREAGYSDVSLDFSTSSNGGERPPSAPRAPEVTAGTPATDIKYAPKIVTNGLDIRV